MATATMPSEAPEPVAITDNLIPELEARTPSAGTGYDEPDYNKIMQRILDMLQANSVLFDKSGNGKGLVNTIKNAPPPETLTSYPLIYVTPPQDFEDDATFSSDDTSEHTARLLLTVIVTGPDPFDTQARWLNISKVCKEILKANVQLEHPTDGGDALVTKCWPTKRRRLIPGVLKTGTQFVDGCEITLTLTLHSGYGDETTNNPE